MLPYRQVDRDDLADGKFRAVLGPYIAGDRTVVTAAAAVKRHRLITVIVLIDDDLVRPGIGHRVPCRGAIPAGHDVQGYLTPDGVLENNLEIFCGGRGRRRDSAHAGRGALCRGFQ